MHTSLVRTRPYISQGHRGHLPDQPGAAAGQVNIEGACVCVCLCPVSSELCVCFFGGTADRQVCVQVDL